MLYFFLAVPSLNSACLIHEIPWARPRVEEMANRYVMIASQFDNCASVNVLYKRCIVHRSRPHTGKLASPAPRA
jgi:hypothetical protein